MKKKIFTYIILSIFAFTILSSSYAKGSDNKINVNAKAIYAATLDGDVIYEYNSDAQLGIASTTKIMTYLLSRELMDKHNIKGSLKIYPKVKKLPSDAAKVSLSSKKKVSLDDLLSTMMGASANDSAEALRYYFQDVEKKDFVKLMNDRAKKLNMDKTYFINACGLTENKNYNKSTARSMYLLAKQTLIKYPEVLKYTNKQYIVFENKKVPTTFKKLLDTGIDGLKTGYTNAAGHCIVATSKIKIDNKTKRVIIVILGEKSSNQRKLDLSKILNFAKDFFKKVNKVSESQ